MARVHGLVTWGLAFHLAVVCLLYGPLGIPEGIVRAVAAWKELAVVLLVAWAAWRVARRPAALVPTLPDVAAVAIAGLVVARGAAELALPKGNPIPVPLLYGARDLGLPFALYLVGRTTPGLLRDPALLRRLVLVGLIATAVAVVERVLPVEALVVVGVPKYYNEFLGLSGFTEGSPFDLPYSYFTDLGADAFRRAGSIFLGGQGFAVALLLILPAAQVLALRGGARAARWWLAYGVLWFGLLLTVTRMTIVAAAVEAVAVLLLAGRPVALGLLSSLGVAGTGGLLLASSAVRSFVWRTLTFDTTSSVSHVSDWLEGVDAMWRYPLGAGLATADATAERFGRTPLTADNLLLKYGVELGVPGLVAFAAFLAGVLLLARRGAARVDGTGRAGAIYVVAVTVGVVVNGLTAVVTNLPFLGYLWPWLAGAAVAMASERGGEGSPAAPRMATP